MPLRLSFHLYISGKSWRRVIIADEEENLARGAVLNFSGKREIGSSATASRCQRAAVCVLPPAAVFSVSGHSGCACGHYDTYYCCIRLWFRLRYLMIDDGYFSRDV